MTIRNREDAARVAEADNFNDPGMCQQQTRNWFNAPSAGDQDKDGDADAVDGWKSEPMSARHEGDRNPPRGVPVSWSGGSSGHGHRAISLGGGNIRSTDAGGRGKVATVKLDWVEKNWGMKYLGWSETITGQVIPLPPPPPKTSRGERVDTAIEQLWLAQKASTGRRRLTIRAARRLLKSLPFIK